MPKNNPDQALHSVPLLGREVLGLEDLQEDLHYLAMKTSVEVYVDDTPNLKVAVVGARAFKGRFGEVSYNDMLCEDSLPQRALKRLAENPIIPADMELPAVLRSGVRGTNKPNDIGHTRTQQAVMLDIAGSAPDGRHYLHEERTFLREQMGMEPEDTWQPLYKLMIMSTRKPNEGDGTAACWSHKFESLNQEGIRVRLGPVGLFSRLER